MDLSYLAEIICNSVQKSRRKALCYKWMIFQHSIVPVKTRMSRYNTVLERLQTRVTELVCDYIKTNSKCKIHLNSSNEISVTLQEDTV